MKIHALPGMGADQRMYPGPWCTLPDFIAHDWPVGSGEMTIADFARTVVEAFGIHDGDVVVGVSLGGMVGCEIAKLRKLEALFLVGSARDRNEVNRLLAWLHPLADIAPIEWLKFSASKIPSDLPRMFAGADPLFIRHMCAAVFRWNGPVEIPTRCLRIHGSRDLIIPPPAIADLILDGGHLITMTHATECVEFVRKTLDPP